MFFAGVGMVWLGFDWFREFLEHYRRFWMVWGGFPVVLDELRMELRCFEIVSGGSWIVLRGCERFGEVFGMFSRHVLTFLERFCKVLEYFALLCRVWDDVVSF